MFLLSDVRLPVLLKRRKKKGKVIQDPQHIMRENGMEVINNSVLFLKNGRLSTF